MKDLCCNKGEAAPATATIASASVCGSGVTLRAWDHKETEAWTPRRVHRLCTKSDSLSGLLVQLALLQQESWGLFQELFRLSLK